MNHLDVAGGIRLGPRALGALEGLAATYERDGFAFVPQLFGRRTVERLRAAVERVRGLGADLERDAEIRGAKFQVQSRSGRPEDGAIARGELRKVTFPRLVDRDFARVEHEPRLLLVAARLGVRGARCAVDQINLKAPRVGTRFPWHQDLAFLGRRDREAFERFGGVNALVALDAADPDNGAFEVIPGSHRLGLLEIEYDLGAQSAGEFDAGARRPLVMAPGDAVFFSPLLVHGSPPNASDRPRRMLAFWLLGTTSA